jgi:AsmA protein
LPSILSRRTLTLVSLVLSTLAVGAAAIPWPTLAERATRAVTNQFRRLYTLDLTVAEPGTIVLLPMPGVRFRKAELKDAQGARLADAEALQVQLRLLPLLSGRVEVGSIELVGARVSVEVGNGERRPWRAAAGRLLERLKSLVSGPGRVERLLLADTSLTLRDRATGREEAITGINAVATWPDGERPLTLAGLAVWRGESVGFRLRNLLLGDLLARRPSPIHAEVNWGAGHLRADGEASLGEAPRLSGTASFEAASLRDFLQWTGLRVGLGSLVGAVSVEGEFVAEPKGASLPSVRLALGSDRLEGAASAQLSGERLRLTATLAADELALTPFVEPLRHALAPDGSWSSEPIDLQAFTAGDLDMRLSATRARLGTLRVQDLAASVLVSQGRIEASIGRAGLNRGSLKARLTVADAGEGIEAKVLGSYDRIDVGALLLDLGHNRWIAGGAQGHVALDATGGSVAALAERTSGRATMTVRAGDLTGISLFDVLRRADRPAPAGGGELRGGRTPFDEAQLAIQFADGQGEVVEGALSAPSVHGHLQGRVSLPQQTLLATARLEAASSQIGPPLASFEIAGPWHKLAVTPDRASLEAAGGASREPSEPSPAR